MPPELSVAHETLTHCPYCALNCGLKLQSEGDAVVGTVRWKESPLSKGALCTKGVHAHQQIGHQDRLTRPLLRRDGTLVEVDWDEGLDAAADGLLRIAAEAGPAANAVLSGGSLTNEKTYLIGKFARLALGTPHIDYNGRFCMVAAGTAYKRAFGADRMMTPLAEIENADLVVVVGANLSAAYPVVIPQALARLRRRGGRVVVVDPRRGRFVQAGDLHLRIKPGTDSVLFGGLLRALCDARTVNERFVDERTIGFDAALRACEHLDADRVSSITDVPIEDLTELADLVGRSERCIYLHGRGPEQQTMGTDNVASIINVGLARGHVGKPGCGINMLTGQRNGQGGREWGQRCDQLPAGRSIDDEADRAIVAGHWGVDPDVLPRSGRTYVEILQMAELGQVRGLLSIGTNMSVSSPDLAAVERQMRAFEHVVMIEPFFSESCRLADVVLPGSVWAEEEGTVTTIEGRVVRVDKAVSPQSGWTDLDVIRALADLLDAADHFSFETESQVFEEMTQVSAGGIVDYAGMSWEGLRADDGIFWPCPEPGYPGTPQLYRERFLHRDGRARFQPVEPQHPAVVTDAAFPYVLTTGRELSHFLSGNQTMRIAEHQSKAPRPVLEVHPLTAAALGLVPGRPALLSSRQGSSTVAWTSNDGLRTDTVFLPYHWVECNRLVAADLDPQSRIPGFKYTPVCLGPAPARAIMPGADSVAGYPVNLDLAGRAVLVVGGGNVATQKIQAMLAAGAHVTVVAPDIDERILARAAMNVADDVTGRLATLRRPYDIDDLEGVWLALACTDDADVNRQVFLDGQKRRVWVNSADDPTNCAWTLPSVARQGDLQLTISTNGRSPALSKWLRMRFENDFDERWSDLLDILSDVRREIRRKRGTSEVPGWLEGLDSGAFDLAMAGDLAGAHRHLLEALGSNPLIEPAGAQP